MSETLTAHPLSQAIYEGVLESPPWKTLLKDLETYMSASSATMMLRRPRLTDPGFTVYLYSDLDNSALENFNARTYPDSPFSELPEKKVFTLNDRVSRSELESLEFFKFLKNYGVSDLIGFDVYDKRSGLRLRLRLVRTANAAPFSQQDRARLQSIVPLMSKALTLYSAVTHNSFVEEFYEELLGSMGIASVILNAQLEVLSANKEATQILSAKDGVFILSNSLRCSHSPDQKKFEAACHKLLKGGVNEEKTQSKTQSKTQAMRSISISRTSLGSKWDAHIRKIDKEKVSFGRRGPKLVLLLQDVAQGHAPSQSRLIERFGVTPAEAKLIPHLVGGLTLTAAAQALGISRNTARAQLSSIFIKTGVNRQTQLVKLVADTFATHWQ